MLFFPKKTLGKLVSIIKRASLYRQLSHRTTSIQPCYVSTVFTVWWQCVIILIPYKVGQQFFSFVIQISLNFTRNASLTPLHQKKVSKNPIQSFSNLTQLFFCPHYSPSVKFTFGSTATRYFRPTSFYNYISIYKKLVNG